MRQLVSDITGTSQEDRDGEEICSALIAKIIQQLPNLTAVAFDFHPTQPRDRWPTRKDTADYFHLLIFEGLKERQPQPGENQDVVLAPLIALSSQIIYLDINIARCPPKDYGALARFLSRFPKLKTLRLADPPELRSSAREAGSKDVEADVEAKLQLWETINSMAHLESLSFFDAESVVDDDINSIRWTTPLKSLTIKGAENLSVASFMEFVEWFEGTLTSLILAECPRLPRAPYQRDGDDGQHYAVDDGHYFRNRTFYLHKLEHLTLGRQQISAEDATAFFSALPIKKVTFGTGHNFSAEECYLFTRPDEESESNLEEMTAAMPPRRKSTRTRALTAKALTARTHGPASFTSLPTEVKEMIVRLVGARLEPERGLKTATTRRTLKSLSLIDKVYAKLAQPYLYQAIAFSGKTNEGLIFFYEECLPRFRNQVTSLLFQRHQGFLDRPTPELRRVVAKITGTSQADRDGEEIYTSLVAKIITRLPNLTSIAFDFYPFQPRTGWPTPDETFSFGAADDSSQIIQDHQPKPRPGANIDFVLEPLLALSKQITSLDINVNHCPQTGYRALAAFLRHFQKLKHLRLADPVQSRSHENWDPRRERDDAGKRRLLRAINSMHHLESLALAEVTELMDDSIVSAVNWDLPLKFLSIGESDELGVGTVVDFVNLFGETLEKLELSGCPRTPVPPYLGVGSNPGDEEVDDETALQVARFDLPNVKTLTLGAQLLTTHLLFPLFEELTSLEHITLGTFSQCNEPDNFYTFAEDHAETLRSIRVRVSEDWEEEETLELKKDIEDDLDVCCELSWRRGIDELDEFDWPVNPVVA
ncbi:hypothetical protein P7C70_g7185, partial [Phenoliferia sp. Uapishka_3]